MSDGFPRGWYPGTSRPLPPVDEPRPENDQAVEVDWDARPYRKQVNGKEVEFFTIGAVATALHKSAVTIRLWTRQGHLPPARYRMPKKGTTEGRRLYTRDQVEAVVTIARDHGILDGDRVEWSRHPTFAAEVREAWNALPPL